MSSEDAANHTWRGQGEKISLSTNKGQSFSSEVSFTGNVRPRSTWHPGTHGGLDVTVRRCLPRSLAGNAPPAEVEKELTLRLPAVFTVLFRSPWAQPPGLGRGVSFAGLWATSPKTDASGDKMAQGERTPLRLQSGALRSRKRERWVVCPHPPPPFQIFKTPFVLPGGQAWQREASALSCGLLKHRREAATTTMRRDSRFGHWQRTSPQQGLPWAPDRGYKTALEEPCSGGACAEVPEWRGPL